MNTTTEDAVYLTSLSEPDESSVTQEASLFMKPVIGALNSSSFWSAQIDSVMSHGASSERCAPLLAELLAENQACISSPAVDEPLMKLIEKYAELKSAFRDGAMAPAQKILADRLTCILPRIMKEKAGNLSVQVVPVLDMGLSYVAGCTAALTDLRLRFQQWKESLAGDLANLRFHTKVCDFIAKPKEFDFGALSHAMSEIDAQNLPDQAVQDLRKLTEVIFTDFLNRVARLPKSWP